MRNHYYNASHCADPTAYAALVNIEREGRCKRHKRAQKYFEKQSPANIVRPRIATEEAKPCKDQTSRRP